MEESRFFVRNVTVSPLGGIRIACFVKNGAGVLTPKRILPHFTLVYVLQGTGSYSDENGAAFDVKAGDAIIVLPGLEHWYGPSNGKVWDELYLVFEGPVFDLWRDEGCFDLEKPVISLTPSDYWLDKIKRAIGENNEGDHVKMTAEAVRMQQLLMDIQNAARTDIEADIEWLQTAKTCLKSNPDVKSAASEMAMSYELFRKKFRKLSGQSPGKYRSGYLMEQACDLLADRSLTLRQIADKLDYCDEYHFSKRFSKVIGWSPREYRMRLHK
ncbi:AraC family transcriptional regulator [Parasphingorhabdus sp. DH2-15]|uniref:helix-turn-helix domain-containing protein n=1 Tax=Parasphingorhabdus sp. DH2-15 TaxID=3444112 RepID=UPI003F684E2B